ncbi:hypothetical protein [Corallococcus exercitus]|uniref:Response regulator n=1 Tax=Corallococcus exercitus TaxID=2316736 RepID=A0A7Y4NB00_9BACT|nr:hypothetical protein [Corallococcus exercitus]NOK07688.1 hypothetical protein [Corallococcus exercitus]
MLSLLAGVFRFAMLKWFSGKKPSLEQMTAELPRAEVLRRGRVVILDDEAPEMIADIRRQGVAVDHWTSTADPSFGRLESGFYDILLLDYGGIGRNFGQDEGLDVLRHLKRVNPALKILAFSSRTFDASKSDFFRLSDGVIRKDAGIREMMEQLETHLARALTPATYHKAICTTLGIDPDSETAKRIGRLILQTAEHPKKNGQLLETLRATAGTAGTATIESFAGKAVDLVIASMATT